MVIFWEWVMISILWFSRSPADFIITDMADRLLWALIFLGDMTLIVDHFLLWGRVTVDHRSSLILSVFVLAANVTLCSQHISLISFFWSFLAVQHVVIEVLEFYVEIYEIWNGVSNFEVTKRYLVQSANQIVWELFNFIIRHLVNVALHFGPKCRWRGCYTAVNFLAQAFRFSGCSNRRIRINKFVFVLLFFFCSLRFVVLRFIMEMPFTQKSVFVAFIRKLSIL